MLEPADPQVALLGYGVMALDALKAVGQLGEQVRAAVYDARFAKPVDEELLRALLGRGIPLITIEDHTLKGGFGSQVLEACNRLGLDTRQVTRLGLPDRWIGHGSRAEQMVEVGLDPASIAGVVRERLGLRDEEQTAVEDKASSLSS